MSSAQNTSRAEQFVVEIDGRKHSSHVYFAEAIAAALLLRNEDGAAKIRLRDLSAGAGPECDRDSEAA